MRLVALLAVILLAAAGLPSWAEVIFQDDFEAGFDTSGAGVWRLYPSATWMSWSDAQNVVPTGDGLSLRATSSSNKIYHDLGVETNGNFRGTWWVYDDGLTRSYAELRAYTQGGASQGSTHLDQLLAAGKYNSTDAEPYNATKYQCRIGYGTGAGWYNLNGAGSPNRSVGWHKFSVVGFSNGMVKFSVDDVLSRTFTGVKARTMDSICLGFGAGSEVNNSWFDGVMVENIIENTLALNTQGLDELTNTLYVKFGQPVMVKMDLTNLAQKVNGCQAMLGYSNYYLFAESGCVAPGGGAWDQLIYNSWDVGNGVPGEIDTAIGVDAQGSVGTDRDGTVASILLTARDREGETYVVFRPDGADVESTMLSDMSSSPVYPFKVDSQRIVVDGTPPTCAVTSAAQNSVELLQSLGSTTNAVQGEVTIVVNAGDSLAGFAMAPTCQVRVGGQNVPVFFVAQVPYGSGIYYYTATISATTPNGVATIIATATDRAGNQTVANGTFTINKDQITGSIALDSFIGSIRAVTFVATGGTAVKSWTPTLAFAGGVAGYTLTDVPAGTSGLSAKTEWNLRRKLPVSLNGLGQGVVDFTGASLLRGGDINGSNSVNIQDYSILKSNWMTHNAVADINGDGDVGTLDYSIMKSLDNWFKLGDEQ